MSKHLVGYLLLVLGGCLAPIYANMFTAQIAVSPAPRKGPALNLQQSLKMSRLTEKLKRIIR
jgi:hypothetical protein